MLEKILCSEGVQELTKAQKKSLQGGVEQSSLYCKDGTGWALKPGSFHNPRAMCEGHGGFSHYEIREI